MDLGTAAERGHLAACPLCAARSRAVLGDVEAVAHALVTGGPPAPRAVAPIWRWPVVAALATAAVGVLLWLVIAARAPDPASHDEARQGQAAIALADISSALFSVEGEPGPIVSEGATTPLPGEACADWWREESLCSGTLGVLTGAIDPTASMADHPEVPGEESGGEL